jgi:putative endonuclease
MSAHYDLGKWGEETALTYLLQKNHQLRHRNFRYKQAEIDLITQEGKMLIFTEVKTRSRISYGTPESFVDYTKIKLLLKAAEHYIHQTNWHLDVRFDIISIVRFPDNTHELLHIEDAFY